MRFLRASLLRISFCTILMALLPAGLWAWGPIGHMTVAYVAYQKLTPAVKVRVRDLLKLNPDYASWDKQVSAGTSAEDHDRMIFMIAAVWADDIKGESQYSDDGSNGGNTPGGDSSSLTVGYSDLLRHRYWHLVDTPFSQDGTALPAIPMTNAETQIAAFRAVLASAQTDELKSYDLVWLLHLVGDVHQPLHCVTRITHSAPTGDAGGNLVKLFGNASSNLHSYWDDLPGSDCKFCSDRSLRVNRAIVLGTTLTPVLAQVSQHALADIDAAHWIRESVDYAKTKAYRAPVGSGDDNVTIPSASSYDSEALRLAHRRIVAGTRLAEVLNAELK